MKVQFTCRIEKKLDDVINKIESKKNIPKSQIINKLIELGLDEYLKKKETDESDKIEKNLRPKFDEIQEKFNSLSDQIKEVDLKSYRINLFVNDFAEAIFDESEKLKRLNAGVKTKLENYKIQIKYIPKLGYIVLKYMKNILNKDIPNQFFSEIEDIYVSMKNND